MTTKETMIQEIREYSIKYHSELAQHGWEDSAFWRGNDAHEIEARIGHATRAAAPLTGMAAKLLKPKSVEVIESARNELAVLEAALVVAKEGTPVRISDEMWKRYGVNIDSATK